MKSFWYLIYNSMMNKKDVNQNLLATALAEIGTKEISGVEDNPEILKYFDLMGEDGKQWKDETAWCSAFMNYVAISNMVDASYALNARSWLQVGEAVTEPKMGDVVVFWRESRYSWKGHVGLFINQSGDYINTLGGNQNNSVSIKPYPASRVLGFRRLKL